MKYIKNIIKFFSKGSGRAFVSKFGKTVLDAALWVGAFAGVDWAWQKFFGSNDAVDENGNRFDPDVVDPLPTFVAEYTGIDETSIGSKLVAFLVARLSDARSISDTSWDYIGRSLDTALADSLYVNDDDTALSLIAASRPIQHMIDGSEFNSKSDMATIAVALKSAAEEADDKEALSLAEEFAKVVEDQAFTVTIDTAFVLCYYAACIKLATTKDE